MKYDPVKFPFLWYDICPECDTELVAIVAQTIGTPESTGGLVRMGFEPHVTWMQVCEHIDLDEM
jgi:hypothetical protein